MSRTVVCPKICWDWNLSCYLSSLLVRKHPGLNDSAIVTVEFPEALEQFCYSRTTMATMQNYDCESLVDFVLITKKSIPDLFRFDSQTWDLFYTQKNMTK